MFRLQGANQTNPSIFAYATAAYVADQAASGNGGLPISLTVNGNGVQAGITKFIALDGVDSLEVINGSVGQIIVDNDYTGLAADLSAAEALLPTPGLAVPIPGRIPAGHGDHRESGRPVQGGRGYPHH